MQRLFFLKGFHNSGSNFSASMLMSPESLIYKVKLLLISQKKRKSSCSVSPICLILFPFFFSFIVSPFDFVREIHCIQIPTKKNCHHKYCKSKWSTVSLKVLILKYAGQTYTIQCNFLHVPCDLKQYYISLIMYIKIIY